MKKKTPSLKQKKSQSKGLMIMVGIAIVLASLGFSWRQMNAIKTTESRAAAAVQNAPKVSATAFSRQPGFTWWYKSAITMPQAATGINGRPLVTSFFVVFKVRNWAAENFDNISVQTVLKNDPTYQRLVSYNPNLITINDELVRKLSIDRAEILQANNGDGVRVVVKGRFLSTGDAKAGAALLNSEFLKVNTLTQMKNGALPQLEVVRYTIWGHLPNTHSEVLLVDEPRRAERPTNYWNYNPSEAELTQ